MEFRESRVDLCSFHKLSQALGCGTHVCLCGQGEGVGSIPGSGQALLLGAGGFLSTPSQPWFIPPSLSLFLHLVQQLLWASPKKPSVDTPSLQKN